MGPQRTRWSNLPSPMFERQGLLLADLTRPQRSAVTNLLTTALSSDGYRKVAEIVKGVRSVEDRTSRGAEVDAAQAAAARASARISTISPSWARLP